MMIILNGEASQTKATNIAMLVDELGIEKSIAIALNTQPIKKDRWAQTPLKENDRIEILQFTAGG